MSKANSLRVILRPAEVLEIACKNRVRSASWSSLASSFAEQPELVEYLIRHRSAVPDPSTFDPFINALRRICWPGRRLPPSHLRAAGQIGRSPESFAALVFEEARTLAWRELHPQYLFRVGRWLDLKPLAYINAQEASMLALRAFISVTLIRAVLIGPAKDPWQSHKRLFELLAQLVDEPGPIQVGEASLALALDWRKDPAMTSAMQTATSKLSQGTGEDRAWLGLGRGLIEGVFAGDPAKADEIFTMALGDIDADTDPWLGLFLHYNAAKALLTGSFPPRISAGDLLAQLAPTPISLEERAGRLQAYYLRVADTRRDHIERARVHLELSRELCDELGSAEFKIRHRWLLAHAQQIADPIGAVESLLAAIELVKNNRQRVRMGRDFSQIFAQLERISVPEETRHALKTRAIELIPGLWAL